MNVHAKYIRLQFDDLILSMNSSGWQVSRGGHVVVKDATWEQAFDALTTGERVRCIVFANQLR